MAISEKDIAYIAELSELELTSEEAVQYAVSLNSIIDYMAQLQELDTSGVEPTTHVLQLHNVFREDVVKPGLSREEALQNAPNRTETSFKVPRIL